MALTNSSLNLSTRISNDPRWIDIINTDYIMGASDVILNINITQSDDTSTIGISKKHLAPRLSKSINEIESEVCNVIEDLSDEIYYIETSFKTDINEDKIIDALINKHRGVVINHYRNTVEAKHRGTDEKLYNNRRNRKVHIILHYENLVINVESVKIMDDTLLIEFRLSDYSDVGIRVTEKILT